MLLFYITIHYEQPEGQEALMAELAIDITNGELTIVSGLVWVVS
jgi:hypothetical protein